VRKSCSITCLYAAPLVPDQSPDAVAWAIRSGALPSVGYGEFLEPRITGTGNFEWWTGQRSDYHRAMDAAAARQLPRKLQACNGSQPVAESASWWGSCSHYGFVDCRSAFLAGQCCCPIGQKLGADGCEPCAGLEERIHELHELPMLFTLDPEDGAVSLRCMVFFALLSCPLPWAWLAILLWRFTRAKESYMRHAAQHERRVVAENWSGTSNMRGPITVKVSSMSGELREIRGFSEYSVILQLRRAVAEVFDTDFDFVGLLFGAELLRPDVDFQTFGQLGMVDGCAVSFVRSDPEGLPRAEKLAGACETNAFAFFRRNRNVYKALDCQHLGQLRLARATVGNFGANYTKGWNCDGCEKHFANGTMLHRCDVCQIDFCDVCAQG